MTMHLCRFEIKATSDAQTLTRLVNHFAQRGLVPSLTHAEAAGSTAFVVIEQWLDPALALMIAEKMHASILVEDVVWSISPALPVEEFQCPKAQR